MLVKANPPRIGWISGGLGVVLIVAVALGGYMLVASDWGASPDPVRATWYLGGIFTIAISGGLTLLLLVWHAYAQREVSIVEDRVHIRRWIEVLTGKPGKSLSLLEVSSAAFVVPGGGAKLLIETPGDRLLMSIWFWSRTDALALREAFERAGVATEWQIPAG